MSRIHWAGTGLSAVPGLRRLIERGLPVTIWNRTREKAQQAIEGLSGDVDIQIFDLQSISKAVKAGDVLVSMLPGDFHVPLARISLQAGAHFVSSSYVSDDMRALHDAAKSAGLCFVNEVGLDPGIDHLMAHHLVEDYRENGKHQPGTVLSFYSYCGGLSEKINDFRYKFSWSPLGVLKALLSPSRSLRHGEAFDVDRPWNAIEKYQTALPGGTETFEVYPNRDSLPFIKQYRFDPEWQLDTFVRGTLRFDGWSEAWANIFEQVEGFNGADGQQKLQALSDTLWQSYQLADGEADRVVLSVELRARLGDETTWRKTYLLDAYGDQASSAMAKLVSVTVSLAVEAVLAGQLAAGVTQAPGEPALVKAWLAELAPICAHIEIIDACQAG